MALKITNLFSFQVTILGHNSPLTQRSSTTIEDYFEQNRRRTIARYGLQGTTYHTTCISFLRSKFLFFFCDLLYDAADNPKKLRYKITRAHLTFKPHNEKWKTISVCKILIPPNGKSITFEEEQNRVCIFTNRL